MIEDARQIPSWRVLECDVCIVGSGAAGIALAKALDSKLEVCILESGGFQPEARTQSLYQGRIVGRQYFPLDACRQRFFGGSTNCWAGFCRPLEPLDFETRDWVPFSGWPITRTDLDPYYERAHELLFLGPYDYRPERWTQGRTRPFRFRANSDLRTGVLQINRTMTRAWGRTYRQELEQAPNVRVLLSANVTEIVLDSNGGIVQQMMVRVLGGPAFVVRARHYVLAAGGIENARLLLASRTVRAAGIGNDHDLVGRFFMEHPHTDNEGLFTGAGDLPEAQFYRPFRAGGIQREVEIWGYLALTPEAQRRERILSSASIFLGPDGRATTSEVAALARAVSGLDSPGTLQNVRDALARFAPPRVARRLSPGPFLAWLETPSEQAPNPESRVMLDNQVDELGVPRVKLDWRLSEIDKYTLRRAHTLIAKELGASGLGRLKLTLVEDDKTWSRYTIGGRHHMGTTRMHDDPKSGVVDRHGVVHGVPNLSIAGSSVFTTSGSANPTLTVVALALRMGRRLSDQLAR
jgi:choline dehydrogenase-like flavoprotein